jgi:hypothetical protein
LAYFIFVADMNCNIWNNKLAYIDYENGYSEANLIVFNYFFKINIKLKNKIEK